MKARILAVVLILSGLFATANKSYAECGDPPCSNPSPYAILTAEPEYVMVDCNVSLDGSASYDNGSITEYCWDFTDDDSYDYCETSGDHNDGAFDGNTPHAYSSPGTHTARLQVKDDNGCGSYKYDVDTCTVHVIGINNTTQGTWYGTIQAAINDANDGDEIVVYPDTYHENLNFNDKAITLTGIDPNDWDVVAATVIEPNGSGTVVKFGADYSHSVLKGLTITGGSTGIECEESSLELINCIISNNTGGYGGIYLFDSYLEMTNCVISENESTASGAGVFNFDSSRTVATDCVFSGNEAANDGGGICNYTMSDANLTNCFFVGNKAGNDGGAIYSKDVYADRYVTATNCIFSGNEAGNNGGAIGSNGGTYSSELNYTVLVNCLFSGNKAGNDGGGIYNEDITYTEATNCTLRGNEAGGYGGGMCNYDDGDANVVNCLFWGNDANNSGDEIYNAHEDCVLNFRYCDIKGSGGSDDWDPNLGMDGGGNIDGDPLFVARMPADDDVVSYWKFDEGSGIIAYDSAGDNNGNIYGATWTTGQIYGALSFDGDGDYVDLGNPNFVGEIFVLSVWIKTSGTDEWIFDSVEHPGSKSPTGVDDWADLYIESDGKVVFSFQCGGNDIVVTSTNAYNDGNWHHIVATKNGRDYGDIYIDGIFESSATASGGGYGVDPPAAVNFGREADGTNYFDGIIDDARIYDKALSAEEIHRLYLSGWGYHLSPGSPCINRGDPSGSYEGQTDIDGDPRVMGGRVDMGADEAVIWFVDVDADGSGDGTSWDDAFVNPQDALSVAGYGDEIWVAEGTYKPTDGSDRSISFELVEGVAVYGGFDGNETLRKDRDWVNNETILSGDLNDDDGPDFTNRSDNSYHVVTGSGTNVTALLDGFTVTGGYANGSEKDSCGGGMYNDPGSPTLANCTFSDNSATGSGGGMFNYESSSPTLTNCTFSGNLAGIFGGGMDNKYSSSPTLTNCVFSENKANTSGGGMHNYSSSSPTLTNCVFSNNSAINWYGGGMDGFVSCSPTLTNCMFIGNSAGDNGGGIRNNYHCSPTLTNCIFWGNEADGVGDEIHNYSYSYPNFSYCDIKGGLNNAPGCAGCASIDGGSNIGEDLDEHNPKFVNVGNPAGPDGTFGTLDDGLQLRFGSPCIDTGNNDAVPDGITKDIKGDDRIINGTVDMGAYELSATIWYVKEDGSGEGTSWGDAANLQDVLVNKADYGDEIWVAGGTYNPDDGGGHTSGDRGASFQLAEGVAVYGGFAGTETAREDRNWVDNQTILSGDIDAEDGTPPAGETIYTGNSYHVVTASDNSLLDGFTITGGYAEDAAVLGGGGIYCVDASPVIRNCIITSNYAKYGQHGGGIYSSGTSSPLLVNCVIAGNFANYQNCGGIYHIGDTLELINCTVVDNASDGIHCSGATLNIDNSIVWHNRLDPDNTDEFPVREVVLANSATATVTYSNVDNGQSGIIVDGSTLNWGVGNISDDPQFEYWGSWEWKLADGNNVQQGTAFEAKADEIIIYDLKKQFADVDLGMNHHEDDFIQDYLDTNPASPTYKKPIWQPEPGDTSTVSNVDNFNLWFSDDPDQDKGSPIQTNQNVPSWICVDKDKGVFRLDSEHFFPIDDWCSHLEYGCDGDQNCMEFCDSIQEFACEYGDHCTEHPGSFSCDYASCTDEHNYFFTLQYHTKFRYIPGQNLRFLSSDDLFVAINNAVVVNRAGYFVDCPSDTEIILENGDVNVYRHNYATCGVDASVKFFDLNLQPYEEYELDIFFAQRRRPLSVFVAERTPGDSEMVASFSPGNYQLTNDGPTSSPCIDAGDNSALLPGVDIDLDGQLRFVDDPASPDNGNKDPGDTRPYVDMGAYEFQVPIAGDDAYSVDKNKVLDVAAPGVLGNDEDPWGDPIEAILVSPPSHGSLTAGLNADGSFIYTPAVDYAGNDSFTYKAQSTVDGHESTPATVTITVVEHIPVAYAGPNQSLSVCYIDESALVTLDGSGSTDSGDDIVSYEWAWTENSEPKSATGVMPEVWMSAGGGSPYEVTLTVTDSLDDTDADTVQITIDVLDDPVANPGSDFEVEDGGALDGDGVVNAGADVTLDGSASTGIGLTYIWYAEGVEIAQGPNPPVRLAISTHTIGLLVVDECSKSDYNEVEVTVHWPQLDAEIDAGEPQEVCLSLDNTEQLHGRDTVELDPSNKITQYEWQVRGVPDGGYIADWPDGITVLEPNVTLANEITGEYKFLLIGKDSNGLEIDTDTTSITVKSCSTFNVKPKVEAWIWADNQKKKEHTITSPTPPGTVTLQGTITDDGQLSGELAGTWKQLSGSINGVQITPLTESCSDGCTSLEVTATATFTQEDTYQLSLKGDDGTLSNSDVVVVHFESGQPPFIEAGENDFAVIENTQVDVNMSDAYVTDRDFPFDNTTQLWTLIDGDPASIEFLDESGQPAGDTSPLEKPTIRFFEEGKYKFQLEATDAEADAGTPDTVWVTITEDPVDVEPRNCTALYAGVSNIDGTGDVYRRLDTTSSWVKISTLGTFNGPVLAFCNYNGNIYAGTKAGTSAAGVWRWNGGASWTKVTDDAWVESQGISLFYALIEYNGNLYAGTNVPNKLFEYDSNLWSAIDVTGHLSGIGSLYVWKDKLFLDAGKTDELGYYDSTCDCWVEVP